MPESADSLKPLLEQGVLFLLVMVVLVPMVRWLMSSAMKSAEARDKMLAEMIAALTVSTTSLRDAVSTFKEFEISSRARDERILATLVTMEASLQHSLDDRAKPKKPGT